jgi:hypothetical protein
MGNLNDDTRNYLERLEMVRRAILDGKATFRGFKVMRYNDWKGSVLVSDDKPNRKWNHKAFPCALNHIEIS